MYLHEYITGNRQVGKQTFRCWITVGLAVSFSMCRVDMVKKNCSLTLDVFVKFSSKYLFISSNKIKMWRERKAHLSSDSNAQPHIFLGAVFTYPLHNSIFAMIVSIFRNLQLMVWVDLWFLVKQCRHPSVYTSVIVIVLQPVSTRERTSWFQSCLWGN